MNKNRQLNVYMSAMFRFKRPKPAKNIQNIYGGIFLWPVPYIVLSVNIFTLYNHTIYVQVHISLVLKTLEVDSALLKLTI